MTATVAIPMRFAKETKTAKKLTKLDYAILVFACIFTVCLLLPLLTDGAFATEGGVRSLTDMFQTKSFRGSSEALTKANWIGMALHYIISWFSFLGLCLTLYQKFITLLYLSARNLFDNIYDIKVNKMKGSFLGYKELLGSLFVQGDNGNRGGGVDVLITFAYSLLPNIKAYCDYCPDKLRDKLDENDGVTQYMLKTAIPTIMLIFFLTIGYSGTLAQAYGTVVDGMAVAADNLVNRNLAGYVKRLVGEGGGYTFSLGDAGTTGAEYGEKVARDIYNEVMGLTANSSPEFQQILGQVIEDSVFGSGDMAVDATGVATSILGGNKYGYIADSTGQNTGGTLEALANATAPDSVPVSVANEEAVKSLKAPHVFVSTSPALPGNTDVTWNVRELLEACGVSEEIISKSPVERYVHVLTYMNAEKDAQFLVPIAPGNMTVE